MKIWISRSCKIYGPYSISSINNFLSGSLLFFDDWAWTTGLDNSWIPLIQILRSNKVITTSTENFIMKTEDIPPAELLLIASVDTELGPRQIRFYWGDLSTLIKEDSVVVISTSCFQPKITGIAWRRILAKIPDIEKVEPNFK